MQVKKRMIAKLETAFSPAVLVVEDQSHLHVGHVGARPEGETHFYVEIVAAAFAGKARVAMHRMINTVLREELATKVHALTLNVRAAPICPPNG